MPDSISQRIFGLDVIRASAILLVMSSHCAMLMLPDYNSGLILPFFKFFGAIGVDLFFVLSGFLIGGIILKHIKNNETKFEDIVYFWIRRWFRTLPNYFLILVLNGIIFYAFYSFIDISLVRFIFFLQNFASPHPQFFSEAWSLSIEEYAYILGPIMLFILVHLFKIKRMSFLFLAMSSLVVLLIFISRYLYILDNEFTDYGDWSSHMRKVVIYRIDSIYFGFFAAYISRVFKSFWKKIKYLSLVAGMVLFFGMHALIYNYGIQPENSKLFYGLWYLSLLSISLLLFFPYFSQWKNGSVFRKQITHISKISYGLYLVNLSLVFIPLRHFIDIGSSGMITRVLVFISYWSLSFIVAHLLYSFYEKPLMDLRNHKYILRYFKKT